MSHQEKQPKQLTKSQKNKANKVFKLLNELSEENITFFMNSCPTLEIGFLRNHNTDWGMYDFQDFINETSADGIYYTPTEVGIIKLKLECYGF